MNSHKSTINNQQSQIYIIAGSNGAGKTTFAREFLPGYVQCPRFINPDLIAAGLSPFDPSAAGVEAGRLVPVVKTAIRFLRAGWRPISPVILPLS